MWIDICAQTLIVETDDAIISKPCLICEQHEEQEKRIRHIAAGATYKFHSSRVILWV
jgi:hypothetical protein